jgi:DNA-binding FadR family transcriptional regulator
VIEVFVRRGYEIILASDDPRGGKTAIEQQHTAILAAIRDRNAEAARLAVHAHLHLTENVWMTGP